MASLAEIRLRANNGVATLSDVNDLLGMLDGIQSKPPQVVYVSDPDSVAKALAMIQEQQVAAKAAADAVVAAEIGARQDIPNKNIRDQLRAQLGI